MSGFARPASSDDAFAFLSRVERDRLDRFANQFDDIASGDFALYAGPARPDSQLEHAMRTVLTELGTGRRHDAIKAAIDRFRDAAMRRYSERFSALELLGLRQVEASGPADRVRVLQSLERAVAALILWDRLDDQTRAALAGPWAELVERSV
jgi:hypothetical protein